MRKTLMTVVLMLALCCCTAFAGEIHTPGSPTPPNPMTGVQEPTGKPTLNNEMPPFDESKSLTQIALELLAVLPSIL